MYSQPCLYNYQYHDLLQTVVVVNVALRRFLHNHGDYALLLSNDSKGPL